MSVLSAPHFHNEEAAYAYVESRLWPNGPVCPHCKGTERIGKMGGASTRIGAYKCYACRKPFTVKIGTVFEASHVPMRHWLQVMFLMASSKKGVSANQVHRTLGCTLKTAWFICHRIREAMTAGALDQFGGNGGGVEADETYWGTQPGKEVKAGTGHKFAVMSLIDRDSGRAYSQVITDFKLSTIAPLLDEAISRKARLITDEAATYKALGWNFADHVSVNHGRGEYVNRQDVTIHTNTVEGFFSVFKRGMRGIYQHCEGKHLPRYLAEFDFRYSNRSALGVSDVQRADIMLSGVVGKRLTYRTTDREA
jgi:transposase-like protein